MKSYSAYTLSALFLIVTSMPLLSQHDESLLMVYKKHKAPVLTVAFSPDDKYIASGSEDRQIFIWDRVSGEVIKTFEGHNFKVQYLSFSPDGDYLLSAGGPELYLWKIETGTRVSFVGHKTHIWNARFSHDGTRIASTSLKSKFNLWDRESREVIRTFDGHTKTTLAIDFSPDDKTIASGSLDQTIKLWDVNSGEVIWTIDAHGGNIYSIAFSPDGKYIASASQDETIKIWEAATGKIVKLLSGHQYAVMYVRFSPDSKYLISASYDRSAKLWEVSTGNCIYTFIDHADIVNVADFSHDGKYIITCSNDGTIMLWELSPRYFAEFYYWDELKKEMDDSGLFDPKQKSETRQDYDARVEKAEKFRQELYQKYYKIYLEKQ